MNIKQLEIIQRQPKLKVSDLQDVTDRTLLYGSHADICIGGCTFIYHLYIQGEMFHFTQYQYKTKMGHKKGDIKSFKFREEITPNMFLHTNLVTTQKFDSECCDYEFCNYLKSKGIVLNFTSFDDERPNKVYYGMMYEDLKFEKIVTI